MKFITEHKERWITGLLLLTVVISVGIVDNYTVMWLFLGAFYTVGVYEALKLYKIESRAIYYYSTAIWVASYLYPDPDRLLFITTLIMAGQIAYSRDNSIKKLILPILYPIAGFLYMFVLYKDYGVNWLFWLLMIVAMSDVGAFFVGKTIGKRKFSPTSPNKTLEGVLGGVLFATIFGTYLAYSMELASIPIAITISLLTSISSIFGDLFESYLKREAGVKDSGDILPGHGGVLDRVDGYLFGAIVMVVLAKAL